VVVNFFVVMMCVAGVERSFYFVPLDPRTVCASLRAWMRRNCAAAENRYDTVEQNTKQTVRGSQLTTSCVHHFDKNRCVISSSLDTFQ
jgi:hypothetical protein